MANHSPEKDNYVAKKTWDAAVEGKAPDVKPEGTKKEPDVLNQARGNGSGKTETKPAA